VVELIAWRLGPHLLSVKQGSTFGRSAFSERKNSAQIAFGPALVGGGRK